MTESKLKTQIGIFLVVSNLLVIGAIIVLYFLGGFLFDEVTTTVALIIPMFSVYTTAIVKSIVSNRQVVVDSSPVVNGSFIFITWVFPIAFTVYLVSLVLLKAYNIGFSSFEQFKTLLIASETIFGAYIGIALSAMFRKRF